jgi:uncharacterized protein (TIGR03437 family)
MRYQSLSVSCLVLFGALACFPQAPVPLNVAPSRIVGHPNPEQNSPIASLSPNLVEGRELNGPEGVALDTSVSPPILYVSDTFNNRVLAWKNAAGFTNGQKADLVIGQYQPSGLDFFHTQPLGPGTTFQAGLNLPSGLAVSGGDLYVADTGNNRVLRFRKPFQNAANLFPDLFIGQPNLNSRAVNNNGTAQVGAQGLSFVSSGQIQTVNLAFDTAGNLWMTDPGNHRALRFAAADVAAGGGPLTANLLIGNLGVFTSVQPAVTPANAVQTNLFATPSGIAFDPAGRLFVSDGDNQGFARVLVFLPPFSNSSSASRIMGVFPSTQPPTSADQISKTLFSSVNSIFFLTGSSPKVGLLDQGGSRILLFDSYDNWPDPATSYSPQATAVVGQTSFSGLNPNGGTTFNPAASPVSLFSPAAAVMSGADLYVADTGNHRVLDLPLQGGTFGPATRVLGQDRFDMRAPNLIEGKEFDFFASNGTNSFVEGGVAIDSSGDTPHLYVADYFNHRVLGFKDFRSLKANARADIVIGQQDFNSGLCNGTGDPNRLTASSLCFPAGVLTDSNGNLYVADSGNGRVLRFPAPFAHQGLEQADLVLGQRSFTFKITDPSPFTMASPYGLAFAGRRPDGKEDNGLLVSDAVHNRVLFFPFTNGTFDPNTDSGKAATKVLGQPDFNTVTPGNTDAKMNAPRHVAADSEARPYVVDAGNNRVLIFDQIVPTPSGSSAAHIISNLGSPRGIYVNALTGEIWITNTNSGTVLKYPKYQSLLFSDASIGSVQSAGLTIAVAQDQYGDLVVADSSNRVSFYFPGLQAMNGGNFLPSAHLAPGMFASICAAGSNCANGPALFGANTVDNATRPNPLPMPTSLDNVQVLFNFQDSDGNLRTQATPLYYVSPTQINFYVPMGAPTSGTVNLEVVQTSTGRVYAASPVAMSTYSPAILMATYNGKLRQALVLNQDNTINSPTNAAARGSTIQIYAVGQGFVPNAPPDGSPATASPLLTTPFTPSVAFNFRFTEEYTPGTGDPSDRTKFVSFSGLAPGYVGLWQINVQVPANVTPGAQIPLLIQAGSLLSTDATFSTTIAVK